MNPAQTRAHATRRAKPPLTPAFGAAALALILVLWPRPTPAQATDAADGGALPRTHSASSARPSPRFGAKATSAATTASAASVAATAASAAETVSAASSAPTLVFHPQRVVVTTVEAWTDLAALSQRATAATGVRVRDLTILAPHSAAMTLVCADAIRCDEALTRLQSAASFASRIEVDNRRTVPHRPTPDQSR